MNKNQTEKKNQRQKGYSIAATLFFVFLFLIPGCKKEQKEIPILPYNQNNSGWNGKSEIMETDNAYYYNLSGTNMSLHYVDKESGTNIPLCNKPECQHDGNEYCTATSKNYSCHACAIYGNRLYCSVLKTHNEAGKMELALLETSLDGTSQNEVVTFYECTGEVYLYTDGELIIHNGVAYVKYAVFSRQEGTNRLTGCKAIDLKTKEVQTIYEEDFNEKQRGLKRLNAFDNYLFFEITNEKGFYVVCRYDILTGERKEASRLFIGSGNGEFVVLDANRIACRKSVNGMNIYNFSTGEKEDLPNYFENPLLSHKGNVWSYSGQLPNRKTLFFYQDNLLVGTRQLNEENENLTKVKFQVIALDGTEKGSFYTPEVEAETIKDNDYVYLDTAVCNISYIVNDYFYDVSNGVVRRCKMDDLLNGTGEFEEVYTMEHSS